ncbi:MAG TPA: hypothetical protein VFU37_12300 [Pyrinomonadaceae bacterium]|nr:hypothetical protein [Pyrinomonadaceae bacterium]
MAKTRFNFALAAGLMLLVLLACNLSTVRLSSLKIGKDKAVSSESSTFEPNQTVYVIGEVSNAPGKVKVKGLLAIEDVEGQKPGPIPGLEKTLELDGSGTATYSFTPPPEGWPKGKYKIEVTLMDDSGAKKDQKSATFTVS